ncbi:HET-domain-containing protein [Corynespora cassiicola Philippines]|uniref:HET-domain-containing protein n=1 Tax=Corynespora cassiicola Philippines TaxID=1448308 RepID=A0A2T2NE42_CORCC|nr:HET-domain-containing protein [Corynespora cassiicola Philippines]
MFNWLCFGTTNKDELSPYQRPAIARRTRVEGATQAAVITTPLEDGKTPKRDHLVFPKCIVRQRNGAALCRQCTDFFPLLNNISTGYNPGLRPPNWHIYKYGKIASIKILEPSTCELCRIMHKKFYGAAGCLSHDTQINVHRTYLATSLGSERTRCSFEARGTQITMVPLISQVLGDYGKEGAAFTGRPVLPSIDPSLIKLWIEKCETHHLCKAYHSVRDFDFSFRLIDVEEQCLVHAPADARYVALSYVWGGVKQVMLNRMTRKILETRGSIGPAGLGEMSGDFSHVHEALQAEGRTIPRTIRDAVKLCQMIGARYLWTDSLCIMQDDDIQTKDGAWTNIDKMAQIPKMDIIYGASQFTIIAACGKDSNEGLPGVHPSITRSKQITGKIGDQTFALISDDPLAAFRSSTWHERAWTFQELVLSKRHLIFLPEQALWHCSTFSWTEDHSLEDMDEPMDLRTRMPHWTTSPDVDYLRFPDHSILPNDFFELVKFIDSHLIALLRSFLMRRLTINSDILLAFQGVLSASEPFIGRFHHGLPINHFCRLMGWCAFPPTKGSGNISFRGLIDRRDSFPSWSWTGWLWDVEHTGQFCFRYNESSALTWHEVSIWCSRGSSVDCVDLWNITSSDSKYWERLNLCSTQDVLSIDSWSERELPKYARLIKKTAIPSNCLLIKTYSSSIYVRLRDEDVSEQSYVPIYASHDCVIQAGFGKVRLPLRLIPTTRDGTAYPLSVIVICSGGLDFWDERDEQNTTIVCLVVRHIDDVLVERIGTFEADLSAIRKLKWKPAVIVLQ